MTPEVRAAQWLGTHAVAAFFTLLVVLLALAALSWRVLRRFERGRDRDPLPPQHLLIRRVALGFAIVAGAAMVFAEMAEALGVGARMGRFDVALAQALGLHLSQSTLHAFAWVTHLGDTRTLAALCIAVATLLVRRGHRTLALGWVLAVAGNGLLNNLLKRVFERARPLHEHDMVVAYSGWSFPSGHSSGAVVAYGMLGYLALRRVSPRWRLPVLLLAAAVAFCTGMSRVFLQVHYASDVLAGFASGLVWLTICVLSIEWVRWRRRDRETA